MGCRDPEELCPTQQLPCAATACEGCAAGRVRSGEMAFNLDSMGGTVAASRACNSGRLVAPLEEKAGRAAAAHAHTRTPRLTMNPIGVIIPGSPCSFPQQLEGDTKWLIDVKPAPDVMCFLTQENQLPPEMGIGIYFSLPPFANWEARFFLCCFLRFQFMGVLTNNHPSVLLSTGWNLLPEAQQAAGVRLGFLLESAQSLTEKLETKPIVDAKKEYARKVALNLYRFVESFQGGGDQTLLDRWFERFEAKYRIDPNFVMKSE
ncbi:uncharacterized protein LOC34624350 [Cyclospora cayetanensis]|uniref:Uncharacterized protein LOC34624350 n=1 Tax=Cyclospora cayetanensis TaxID=88456 RepID=A0A6P6S2V0_9EIME|nr:uncharacterized protein LOC34624350 [Cyclospora cayetanensis]